MNATAVKRGCGSRIKGGVYMECGTSPTGEPLERFIVDPPRAIDPEALGLSPVGVTLHEIRGVTHVFDWIGKTHYPNVADFVEEVRRYGASRRLPRNLDFSRLTAQSRMILIHERGHIENHGQYLMTEPEGARGCPAAKHDRKNASEMCARFWWQDVILSGHGYGTMQASDFVAATRRITRQMPSFSYEGFRPPHGVEAKTQTAIFLSLPINRLVVVRSDDGSHEDTARRIEETAGIPLDIENE